MPNQTIEHDHESVSSAALCLILELHPAHFHIEELIREMANDPSNVSDRDYVTVAVDSLHRSGLVHRSGEFVFASRAAVQAHALYG